MPDLTYAIASPIIPLVLDAGLRDALGDAIYGMSSDAVTVVVHFADEPTAQERGLCGSVLAEHLDGVKQGTITAPAPEPTPLEALQAKYDALAELLNAKDLVTTAELDNAVQQVALSDLPNTGKVSR